MIDREGARAEAPPAQDRGVRLDFDDAWEDALHQKELARKRVEVQQRKQAAEAAAWTDFMRSERREIRLRQEGQLARLLGKPLPGELAATLERLAAHDQMQARRGLVALMSGGTTTYKPLEDLAPDDMPARIAANRLRTTWLKERRDGWLVTGEADR